MDTSILDLLEKSCPDFLYIQKVAYFHSSTLRPKLRLFVII